jgi:hypothetical protein
MKARSLNPSNEPMRQPAQSSVQLEPAGYRAMEVPVICGTYTLSVA